MNQQDKAAGAVSIDTPEFEKLVRACSDADALGNSNYMAMTWTELVAHIAAHAAQHAERRAEEVAQHQQNHIEELKAQLAGETTACDLAIKHRNTAEASLARLVEGVEEVMRPYGIYDVGVAHSGALQTDFIATGNKLRALLPAKAEGPSTSAADPALYVGIEKCIQHWPFSAAAPAPAMGDELPPNKQVIEKFDELPPLDERAEFESAMNSRRFFPAELSFMQTKSPSGRDEYANSHLQSCWGGWQARACMALRQPGADKAGDLSLFAWINPETVKRENLTGYAETITLEATSVKFGHHTTPIYLAAAPVSQPAAQEEFWLYRAKQGDGSWSEWRNAPRYEWHSWMETSNTRAIRLYTGPPQSVQAELSDAMKMPLNDAQVFRIYEQSHVECEETELVRNTFTEEDEYKKVIRNHFSPLVFADKLFIAILAAAKKGA